MKLVKYVTILIAVCVIVVTLNVGAVHKSAVRDSPIRARPKGRSEHNSKRVPRDASPHEMVSVNMSLPKKIKKNDKKENYIPVRHLSELSSGDFIKITSKRSKKSFKIPYSESDDARLSIFKLVAYETHSVMGYGFQSSHGTYLTAESDRKLTVDRAQHKSMEHFQIEFPHELAGSCIIRCTKTRQLITSTNKGFRMMTASIDELDKKEIEFQLFKINCEHLNDMCNPSIQLKDRNYEHWNDVGNIIACASPKSSSNKNDISKQDFVYKSWERIPHLQWIIISEHDSVLQSAVSHKFETDDSPELHTRYKQPTYRGLFSHALQSSPSSKFVMYTNGDIMYTYTLSETLHAVFVWMEKHHPKKHVFIVGQRTNIDMPKNWDMGSEHDDWSTNLEDLGKQGSVYQADAEDYFIMSRGLFQWDTIPDFVVGGVAFDNWLVGKAVRTSAITIDVSKTVSAIHQNHGHESCGTKCSHQTEKSKYNLQLAKKHGGTSRGRTVDCTYVTVRTSKGVEVVERDMLFL